MPDPSMRVLVDTNVALDLLQERQPYVWDALQIFALGEASELELLLSSDSVSTIFYVVSRNASAKIAREALAKLLDIVKLAPLDEKTVLRGMSLDFVDIEDVLIAAVAERSNAQAIVTRNARDFENAPLPVMTPAEFLAFWQCRN